MQTKHLYVWPIPVPKMISLQEKINAT